MVLKIPEGAGPPVRLVELLRAAADHPAEALLIRPDGYVAWASEAAGHPLRDALERWFGPSTQSDSAQSDSAQSDSAQT
ncbi:hypothetical protein [Nonomuraea sp. NPDC049709]|uniref:aromatic-ring hydroxylase C-terminal domain-containing protein n=1 Tax=Nonomuraea sp. NPDC049709 TaxID=3154736 RepID=UPI0034465B8B